MLLLPDARLEERRRLTRTGELDALYESLAAELQPLLDRDLYFPDEKALLSRRGGRCERDGTTLEFDPWSPHTHRCARCGASYTGTLHHRAWVVPYQLWLAERAVHAALFFALRGEKRHAELARRILEGCAARYLSYPNIDNVLGPTRPFFSTYLESIWLLQICIAIDLLSGAGDDPLRGMVAERLIEPSRSLISEFDEGMSNRQVWNNAALMAAATTLGDERAFDQRLTGRTSSLTGHLETALLSDATWYEGENYHQFALRGLWYGVTIAEGRGAVIAPPLRDRFERAFEVLYLTALPDFTMPSRKDSQYAVSLRQWRMAELAELGFARRGAPVLASALARTYEEGHGRADTERARSAADVERNTASGGLTRADLGWRALLHAVPALPGVTPRQPQSTLLEAQGLSVFRRSSDVHVALDYGNYGGDHGHPDRLNLTVATGAHRILDDLGTGSYVDPSLHWYRSTLAHNAPLVNGHSQPKANGVLVAHDERGALGWTVSAVEFREPDVRIERTIVVAPEYVVDELQWRASDDVRVELPWHLAGECGLPFAAAALDGADGLEDGFRFVEDIARVDLPASFVAQVHEEGERPIHAWLMADHPSQLFRGRGPGQPSTQRRPFYLLRTHGREGRFRAVVAWSELSRVVFTSSAVEVEFPDQARHVHRRDEQGWHVELFAMGARSSVDLGGFRAAPATMPEQPAGRARRITVPSSGVTFELGERHYRRSEQSWHDAGEPTATVTLAPADAQLRVSIDVCAGDRHFAAADATNEYDNEPADTMAAGVQLFLKHGVKKGGWMLVPVPDTKDVRVRVIPGWSDLAEAPTATWDPTAAGYRLHIGVPLAEKRDVELDVLVNESTAGRARRRGQLVLSGAEGEFVYLRGDRHDEKRLVSILFAP